LEIGSTCPDRNADKLRSNSLGWPRFVALTLAVMLAAVAALARMPEEPP
jgi:hypothetical protein